MPRAADDCISYRKKRTIGEACVLRDVSIDIKETKKVYISIKEGDYIHKRDLRELN